MITFELKDSTRLTWKSRSGDYKNKIVNVHNVVKFANSVGLFANYEFL